MEIPKTPPTRGVQEQVRAEIRAHMARIPLTIPALAKELGRSDKWLRARISALATVDLTVGDIAAIAHCLGVDVQSLFPDTGKDAS